MSAARHIQIGAVVAGVDVRLPAVDQPVTLNLTFETATDVEWTVEAAGALVATIPVGTTTTTVTIPAAANGHPWALAKAGQTVATGGVLRALPTAQPQSYGPVELTVTDAPAVTISDPTGPAGPAGADGDPGPPGVVAAVGDLVDYDAGTQTITVTTPTAAQVPADPSAWGGAATDTQGALGEIANWFAVSMDQFGIQVGDALADKENVGVAAGLVDGLPVPVGDLGIVIGDEDDGELPIGALATIRVGGGVSNTTTETSLFTLPSPSIALDPILTPGQTMRVVVGGNYTNNSGMNRDLTVRVKIGSTAVVTVPFVALSTAAGARRWNVTIEALITDLFGSTYAYMTGTASISEAHSTPSTSAGPAGALLPIYIAQAVGAAPHSVQATAQHSAAGTTITAAMMIVGRGRWAI